MFLDDETMAPAAPATDEGAMDNSADTMETEKTEETAMPSEETAA